MKKARLVVAGICAVASALCAAQTWSPQKNVEIVAASVPGGSNDNTARTLERAFSLHKLVPATLTIVNKPGGGATIAHTYVNQRAGDPHYLLIATSGILSNHIIGASPLTVADFTPIASLLEDYVVFAVSSSSPIKTGKDLADRMKKDPKSLSLGFANAFGSSRHIAAGLFIKALGGNPRDLKPVVFKGSAEAIPAVLGGHIDVVVIGAVNAVAHVASGRMRIVGVGAPQRLSGVLASAPTWREQGVDVAYGSWRAVFGPKGLTGPQVAYWEGVLRKATDSPEWKADLEKNFWSPQFVTGAQLRKDLEQEYASTRAVLVDLGLAK
ncbi:MAG TPA: tripartite tricarboxylate transporter substrate binding protein [Burkholderiales bacterium]|nr:tripartite tricarboxylate transporter substrate binding protein [Burkholderiales bacterium]